LAAMLQTFKLKQKFRFKNEFFQIDGISNIPAHVICAGNYDLRSYCCKNCGEIYVVDFENPDRQNVPVKELAKNKYCKTCGVSLEESIVKYPENIYFAGSIHSNNNKIDYLNFEETYLKATYTL
jgi:hypothetical protein